MRKTEPLPPSLENLAIVLRNKRLWPDGFEWDYERRSCCALGLCDRLGWTDARHEVDEVLKIDVKDAYSIFCKLHMFLQCRLEDVKPEQVALVLEIYVREHPCE